jgi:hypothetical protein
MICKSDLRDERLRSPQSRVDQGVVRAVGGFASDSIVTGGDSAFD